MVKILLILFLWLFPLAQPINTAAATPVTDVYIHYYRYQGDYTPWDLWVWKNQPTSEAGAGYSFCGV